MVDADPVPLGLYDHPPDPSFSGIGSYKLPETPLNGVLRTATKAANDANRFLTNLIPGP